MVTDTDVWQAFARHCKSYTDEGGCAQADHSCCKAFPRALGLGLGLRVRSRVPRLAEAANTAAGQGCMLSNIVACSLPTEVLRALLRQALAAVLRRRALHATLLAVLGKDKETDCVGHLVS